MARKSINELLAQADATIEDNSIGAISPADVRNMIKDFLDTMRPSYAGMELLSVVKSVTATYDVIAPWATQLIANNAEWTTNLSGGTIVRSLNGVVGNSTRITLDIDVEGPNNNLTTFALFKNGTQTPFEMSGTTLGAGRPVSLNFSGIVYNDVNATFDLRVKGDSAIFTLTNGLLILENVPVASFT